VRTLHTQTVKYLVEDIEEENVNGYSIISAIRMEQPVSRS